RRPREREVDVDHVQRSGPRLDHRAGGRDRVAAEGVDRSRPPPLDHDEPPGGDVERGKDREGHPRPIRGRPARIAQPEASSRVAPTPNSSWSSPRSDPFALTLNDPSASGVTPAEDRKRSLTGASPGCASNSSLSLPRTAGVQAVASRSTTSDPG